MAATSLRHIEGRLKDLIDYVKNPDFICSHLGAYSRYGNRKARITYSPYMPEEYRNAWKPHRKTIGILTLYYHWCYQKEYLLKYAKEHGFPNPTYYVDDGYASTNFDRPSFKKMSEDIEKDLSRFGRNYIEVGSCSEIIYPEAGVRFIAVMTMWTRVALRAMNLPPLPTSLTNGIPKAPAKR